LYDPRNYNDRLLLGLKGTLSEAELHVLRQRMHEGRLNKARRGEVFTHAPLGYVRCPSGGLAMDPDQQVQSVVRLVFEKFAQLGTLNGLLQYLVRRQVKIPVRPLAGAQRGQLQWRRPNSTTLNNLLHHPIYAGAYTWGRRQVDPRHKVPGRRGTGRKMVAAEQCQVLIKDRCPAYITWEQYDANRRQMADNANRAGSRGAPREGPSLLGGLLECGVCGRRMNVQYSGKRNTLRYCCGRNYSSYGTALCQSIRGDVLDQLVQRLVLAALEPAALELSLAATADLQKEQQRLERHWRQRLERAGYESDRAARQYHATEPENRLVARELEKRWEHLLGEKRDVEEAHARFLREQPAELTEDQAQAIRQLASDIPALWRSPETPAAERQQVMRYLIDHIVLRAPANREVAEVTVHWAGGCVSHQELIRPVARYNQLRDFDRLAERVGQLRRAGYSSPQIAATLNDERWRPPRGGPFKEGMIRSVFFRRDRPAEKRPADPPAGPALEPGEWWLDDLGNALKIPQPTLYRWARRGWVHATRLPIDQGRWVLWADDEEIDRLRRLRNCPKTWHGKPRDPQLTRPKPRPSGS